ncbi:hypothetical protein LTR78_001116, partial [Recurvomyces mirabilis]
MSEVFPRCGASKHTLPLRRLEAIAVHLGSLTLKLAAAIKYMDDPASAEVIVATSADMLITPSGEIRDRDECIQTYGQITPQDFVAQIRTHQATQSGWTFTFGDALAEVSSLGGSATSFITIRANSPSFGQRNKYREA